MKALSKNDVKVLGVLVDWGCQVEIDEAYEGEVEFSFSTEVMLLEGVAENNEASFTDAVVSALKEYTPPAGTPNSKLTDSQKGLIQLLFEVEKAIA
jgi:hypothetical protein